MKNREPVLVAGGLASGVVMLVGAFLAMAVSLGWWNLTPEQIDSVNGFAIALVAAVAIAAPFVAAWLANRKVQKTMTPLDKPTDIDGEPLKRGDNKPLIRARPPG